jgi:ubiquinone/menaquinone biosynthesis C-methylase UbiE
MNMNPPNIKSVLSDSLAQKFLVERLMRFINEKGISGLLLSMRHFTLEEAIDAFRQKLGYQLQDGIRRRMAIVIIDLLHECEYVEKKDEVYVWAGEKDVERKLSADDHKIVKETFKGQVDFFERCIMYADNFLSGSPALYSFDSNSTEIWEEFLGNSEFTFARSVLISLLFSGRSDNANVLTLCYGPGFDILQMQEQYDIKITAVDFKDIFQNQASRRIPNPESVKWIKSELWKGFGTPLPFTGDAFDVVFFACADPYIPAESREYVYRDIFRALKPGGALGILTRSYPDAGRKYVKDVLVRRGTLCHDFAESVCEGWRGFYPAQESIDLFKSIGFNVNTVMLNAALWRLDKP